MILSVYAYNSCMPQTQVPIDCDTIMRDVLVRYQSYGDKNEIERIQSAYDFAKKAHIGVLRKSGDAYIAHPVAAVQELIILEPDSTTIIATLLHDVVSHGESSYEDIGIYF